MVHSQNQISTWVKPVLIGTAIGFLVISFFVVGATGKPEWGPLWMVRPLIVTPLAGAAGGAFYYFMDTLRRRDGVNPTVAIILSIVVFVIGLWMGVVLGLAGTMWN